MLDILFNTLVLLAIIATLAIIVIILYSTSAIVKAVKGVKFKYDLQNLKVDEARRLLMSGDIFNNELYMEHATRLLTEAFGPLNKS